MAEREDRLNCSICGETLRDDEEIDTLCADCVDAWEREVEVQW